MLAPPISFVKTNKTFARLITADASDEYYFCSSVSILCFPGIVLNLIQLSSDTECNCVISV
jgi:hypothetical protein